MATAAMARTDTDLDSLEAAYIPHTERFRPEDSPFTTLFADITHRCNMACHNCYIPVRELPDLPAAFLYDMLARLPRRTRIRLVGAEPTMRKDLPEIIARVRELGHIPVVLSNGLKLGNRAYVDTLRAAGLRTVYLSLNGGLDDSLYEEIDGVRCAARKLAALDNLLAAKMHVTTGTILIPGLNTDHIVTFLPWLIARGVRDMHFRSVGQMGRYMEGEPLDLDGLEAWVRRALPPGSPPLELTRAFGSSRDFRTGNALIQLTQWPELASRERGRITPDGFVEPMFESILANANHY